MEISNSSDITESFGLSSSDLDAVRRFGDTMESRIDELIAAFYQWLEGPPEFREYFSDPATLERVKDEQKAYWRELLRADIDETYMNRRRDVGGAHVRINLPIELYCSAMSFSLGWLLDALKAQRLPKARHDETLRALVKIVNLDMALMAGAYGLAPCEQLEARRRADEEHHRLARENALLAEIGRIVNESLEISEAYQRFAQLVRELIPFDRLNVNLVDLAGGTFTTAYVAGVEVPGRAVGEVTDLDGTSILAATQTPSGLRFHLAPGDELPEDLRGFQPGVDSGFLSFLIVPLTSGEEVIGTLHWQSAGHNAYSPESLILATRVAVQVSNAIKNSELHASLTKEAEERLVLAEIGRIVSSSLDVGEIHERFADSVRTLIQFDRLTIKLLDAEAGVFTDVSVSVCGVPGQTRGDPHRLVGTLSEEAINSASPVMFHPKDRAEVERLYPGSAPGYDSGLRSFVSAPLIVRERPVGSLNFRSAAPCLYTERDRTLSGRVASQIAGAVAGAQAYDQLVRVEESLAQSNARLRGRWLNCSKRR